MCYLRRRWRRAMGGGGVPRVVCDDPRLGSATPLASGGVAGICDAVGVGWEGEAPAELESRQNAAQQELRPPGIRF